MFFYPVCIYLFYSRKIACFDGGFEINASKKYFIINLALFCLWLLILLIASVLNIAISVSAGIFGGVLVAFIGLFVSNYFIYGRVEGIQKIW